MRGYGDGPGARGYYSGPPGPRRGAGMPGPPAQDAPPIEVDRTKVCPLLLRVFPCTGHHHKLEEYAVRGKEPEGEVQIYTWKDATLRELAELVREARPEARGRARLSFALVYPDRFGRNVMKQVGVVLMGRVNGPDDNRALAQLGFQTGDFLDVCIHP